MLNDPVVPENAIGESTHHKYYSTLTPIGALSREPTGDIPLLSWSLLLLKYPLLPRAV